MIDIKSVIPCVHAFRAARNDTGRGSSYHYGMTVYDVRLRNLQKLVADFGSLRQFSEHAGVYEAHIRQVLNGGTLPSGRRKNVGNDLARRIEDRLYLGDGWMDMPHDEKPKHPEELRLAADEQMLIVLYRRASPELRKLIRTAAELARPDSPSFEDIEAARQRSEQLASPLDKHTTRRARQKPARKKTGTND